MKFQTPNPKLQRNLKRQTSSLANAVAFVIAGLVWGGVARGDDQIHYAAENGELERVEAILKSKPQLVNALDEDGRTPLVRVLRDLDLSIHDGTEHRFNSRIGFGRTTNGFIVRKLETEISNGKPKVKAEFQEEKDFSDETAMELFRSDSGSLQMEVVKYLLASGADTNGADRDGCPPLILAVEGCHKQIAELLIAYKADVSGKDRAGRTPLSEALKRGRGEIVKLLLACGTRGEDNIGMAAATGNLEKIKTWLKQSPALLDSKDMLGLTPLHYASMTGETDVGRFLLGIGADVNATAHEKDFTALHLAVLTRNKPLVELLLVNKADADARASDLESPLILARRTPLDSRVILMKEGKPTLYLEEHGADDEIAKILRQHGAKRGVVQVAMGEELLHAASSGDAEKVRVIIERQPFLANAVQDYNAKWSVLHEAVAEGRKECVDVLLANQSDANVVNSDDETPLHWAVRKGRVEIAKLLLDAMADPNLGDKNQRTALHEAAFRGQKEIVELLIAAKADVNAKDAKGKTPLFYALDGEHKEIAEMLRKAGGKE